MNRGLLQLWKLLAIAQCRSSLRSLRYPGRATVAAVGLLYLGGLLWLGFQADGDSVTEGILPILPGLYLLALTATTCSSRDFAGSFWTAPEVDYLFTAPVARRELLLYKHIAVAGFLLGICLLLGLLLGSGWAGTVHAFAVFSIIGLLGLGYATLLGQTVGAVDRLHPSFGYAYRAVLTTIAIYIGFVLIRFLWEWVPLSLNGLAPISPSHDLRGTLFGQAVAVLFSPVYLMFDGGVRLFLGVAGGLGIYLTTMGASLLIACDIRRNAVLRVDRRERPATFGTATNTDADRKRNATRFAPPMFSFLGGSRAIIWLQIIDTIRSRPIGKLSLFLSAVVAIVAIVAILPDLQVMAWPIWMALFIFLMTLICGDPRFLAKIADESHVYPVTPRTVVAATVLGRTFLAGTAIAATCLALFPILPGGSFGYWILIFLLPSQVLKDSVGFGIHLLFRNSVGNEKEQRSRQLSVNLAPDAALLCAGLIAGSAAITVAVLTHLPTWVAVLTAWIILTTISATFLELAARCFNMERK